MLIATVYNKFKWYGSDTFDLVVNWRDGTGNSINLSGWHARLRLFSCRINGTMLHEINDTSGITLGNGTTPANIVCTIPDEDVVTVLPLPGFLTLELEQPDGNWQRLLEGNVTATP